MQKGRALRVVWDTGRDTDRSILHSEGVLEEVHDTPDRNHHENSDNSPEHDLQAFTFRFTGGEDVANKTPEEDDYGGENEKANQDVEDAGRDGQEVKDATG